MNDYELLYLIQEQNEDAQQMIYQKYTDVIRKLINKNYNSIKVYNIDISELYNDCLGALQDAIINYNPDFNVQFSTYVGVAIKRRIAYSIRSKYRSKNSNILCVDLACFDETFLETIPEDKNVEPLNVILRNEKINEKDKIASETLSGFEYRVYSLIVQGIKAKEIASMLDKNIGQIYNAIQRIKYKLKSTNFD